MLISAALLLIGAHPFGRALKQEKYAPAVSGRRRGNRWQQYFGKTFIDINRVTAGYMFIKKVGRQKKCQPVLALSARLMKNYFLTTLPDGSFENFVVVWCRTTRFRLSFHPAFQGSACQRATVSRRPALTDYLRQRFKQENLPDGAFRGRSSAPENGNYGGRRNGTQRFIA